MSEPTIKINGVEFTPRPDCAYKNNYANCVEVIETPSLWYKAFPSAAPGSLGKELVERSIFRNLVCTDLWFIAAFILQIPNANHPFVVSQAQVVENGPPSMTLDIWSRGHFKSSLITAAETIQYHLKWPEYCSLIMSYKKGLAEKLTDSTRRAYEMEFMQFLFPDELYSNPSVQAPVWSIQNGITIKRKNTTRREPTIYASGLVEGMAQGFHVERRLLDDFETEDMKNSPDVMDDVFEKYEMSQFLGTKTERDVERIIGTIYSHLGPIMRVKDKKKLDGTPMYHCRIVPGTEGGEYDGKPVLWSQETLDREKTQAHYAMQVLCDPTPKKLRKLNSEFLIDIEPELIPKTVLKFMIVDPAGESNGKKGCDWAILVLGVNPKIDELGASDVYLMNALIDDLKEAEAPEAVARMYLGSGIIQKVGVEKVAQSTAEIHIASMLSAHGRRISIDDGTLVILRPAGRNKMARIEKGLVWPLNNAKLHMSKAVPKIYRDKIRMSMDQFPFGKVDGIDAWSYLYDETMMNPQDMQRFQQASQVSFKREIYKMKTPIG